MSQAKTRKLAEQAVLSAEQSRTARAGLGWSVRKLAQEVGIGTTTLSRFEMGHADTRPGTAEKIRSVFEREGVIFERGGIRFPAGVKVPVRVSPGALVKVSP